MSEENGQQFPPYIERTLVAIADLRAEMKSELAAICAEIASLNERLAALEEKVDNRLRETRPVWEMALARLDTVELKLTNLDDKLEVIAVDRLDRRAEIHALKKRLPPAA